MEDMFNNKRYCLTFKRPACWICSVSHNSLCCWTHVELEKNTGQ